MSSQITASPPGSAPLATEEPQAAQPSSPQASLKPALEFKGLSHPALRVIVNDASEPGISQTLAALSKADNSGFEWQPVIIDASRLGNEPPPDWQTLVTGLRALRLHPVGLAGAAESQRDVAFALQLGWLAALPDPKPRPAAGSASTAQRAAPAPDAPRPSDPLIIDRPVRSGQQIYARDRDLIVLGGVSPGAEVIADGHVHIYGPLGGRAIAGARGRRDALILTLTLQAELVAVSGIYRTFEEGLSPELVGKPVRIALDLNADTLSVKGL